MTDRYAVVGNPVEHSKSPQIHAAFAQQTREDIVYERLLAPLDGFKKTVEQFFSEGGKGLNVTVPFKREAWNLVLCDPVHEGFALDAEAVNTIKLRDERWAGFNTDGIGLVNDIEKNLGISLLGKKILLLGAGGASRGVMFTLRLRNPKRLVIANRTDQKAELQVRQLETWQFDRHIESSVTTLEALPFSGLEKQEFDVVINATSAGLSGESLQLPGNIFAPGALAYDMVYGRETPFMDFARRQGARPVDGLGMLVEQAAESFYIWRGVRPQTAPVIAQLRANS